MKSMTPDTAYGRISSMMMRADNRDKLSMLHEVAEYIFGTNFVAGKTGEQITLETINDQAHEIDALKLQLPFLMNIKAGSCDDDKASSIYEDVYSQLCEKIDPHVKPTGHGGSSINNDSLCHSVVDSFDALLEFWLANKDNPNLNFKLGDTFVDGLPDHEE